MKENIKKTLGTTIILIWTAIVLSAFYITQHPLFPQILMGIAKTGWAILLTLILLFNSASIGYWGLNSKLKNKLQLDPHEFLILGTGIGIGVFGFLGYGLGALGLANPFILFSVLFIFTITFLWFKKDITVQIKKDLISLGSSFLNTDGLPSNWLQGIIGATLLLGFFFALLPPAEGFDALFYHLALPEKLLIDKGILPYAIPQFWFPSLVEGDFIWALGLGSERTAQLLHWSFSILTIALIWEWSRNALGHKTAWWSLIMIISIPSLPWLSSWAYTDFALTFYSVAALYAIWKCKNDNFWLLFSGVFSGMAMGIKYTSFLLPIICIFFILWERKINKDSIKYVILFSIITWGIAAPWYIRNFIIMGNPVYPFALGGISWDIYLANWYADKGSGIGWNLKDILLIPLTSTLGYRDQNYFDGRVGPLFLLFSPITIWTIWENRFKPIQRVLIIISFFTLMSSISWIFGVIQTIRLWQMRLFLPALIPFSIPIGFAVSNLQKLDLPKFKTSFILTTIIWIVLSISLLDNTLYLIVRNPLRYFLGIESRAEYFERVNPDYSELLSLVDTTQKDAYLYFLFEPRSYNVNRKAQPDPINANLAHDYSLYGSPENIIQVWKTKGITHILVSNKGAEFLQTEGRTSNKQLIEITSRLALVKQGENYALYSMP